MKTLTKAMSSPSRTEKFPPPLMRFLRSNAGSRSRGRPRSSPMFIRKKNAAIETTQEPSSPKVTCIGQVRVRRSSKSSGCRKKHPAEKLKSPCSCSWVRKALFCPDFAKKLSPKSVFRKCDWFFSCGCCRKSEIGSDLPKIESNRENEEDEAQVKVSSGEGFCSSPPPKNAFLLTRCRSAPYRSSSLASKFWGSPLTKSETGDDNGEKPTSENEPSCGDSASESKIDQEIEGKLGFLGELKESIINEIRLQEQETGPRLLKRCKSEPARAGERLNPARREGRRSGFAEPRSSHVSD